MLRIVLGTWDLPMDKTAAPPPPQKITVFMEPMGEAEEKQIGNKK